MSWAEEDWTVGLSGRALQKVKDLQVQQERLSRENKQRQIQLDNTQATLNKQTIKYEETRGELQAVQRELKLVHEESQAGVRASERLSQEVQTKQALVCSLEGQLEAARTLTHNLTQEVKSLEVELEKLQNGNRPSDSNLFSTPCWNMASPWERTGGGKEEHTGHRGGDRDVRQQLQYSDTPTSSVQRQQNKNTPLRHRPDQSDVFASPSSVFPWERNDSRLVARGRSAPSPQTPHAEVISRGQVEQVDCGIAEGRSKETETCLSELQSRVGTLEAELRAEAARLKEAQAELGQSRKEVSASEHSLQRAHDQLSLAHTRMAQESERASGAEQRLRQLQEELKCQRQNAESIRLQNQQRVKDLEKQHQRDVLELQKERQCLEKQHQQEVNKLNQELQQARTLHNALQSQAEKVSLQKQALEKEIETLKEKLKWTEGELKESQRKDAQTQAKLTEAQREAEGVAAGLEQSKRRERALEEEGRRLAEERADALHLLKELQDQKAATPLPPVQFTSVGQSYPSQPYTSNHPPRPQASTKQRPASGTSRCERAGGVDAGEQVSGKYPSDREPGEGIDSEHITAFSSQDSERLRSQEERGNTREEDHDEERKSTNNEGDAMRCDGSGTETLSKLNVGAPNTPAASSMVCDHEIQTKFSLVQSATLRPDEHTLTTAEDLRKENASLRSELCDAREELQKRLEDLESQRRAEAEARTRLKQLSRKHASQAGEKEEQEKQRKAEQERMRAEAESLRKALAALESEVKREREARETMKIGEFDEAKERALEDRESEMMDLNVQLKKQLAEVKAQLALERDERERDEEERKRMMKAGREGKVDLSLKLAELKAELEEVKSRGKKELLDEKKLPEANSPLTYLSLHNDELNSNVVSLDDKLLPSPEHHRLFCESANQRNADCSWVTDLIQEQSTEDQTAVEDTTLRKHLQGSCTPDHEEVPMGLQRPGSASCDLTKEVERLREEKNREVVRAKQCQAKLEAMQSQVTRQTQQLTMAFDRQSQHITDLLAELQEKEGALRSQEEELLRCRQDLATLGAQREDEVKTRRKEGVRMTVEGCAEKRHEKEGPDKRQVGEITRLNHSEELTNITYDALSASMGQEYSGQKKTSPGKDVASCPGEEMVHSTNVLSDVIPQGERHAEDKESEIAAEEVSGTISQPQSVVLPQQMEALQTALQVLSEENQRQAEELVMWRLTSQPVPTLDQKLTQTCNPPHILDQTSALRQTLVQSDQQQQQTQNEVQALVPTSHAKDEDPVLDPKCPAAPGVPQSPSTVTVIREDELLLSCSSNRMQGRTLGSRLQHSNHPETKTVVQHKRKTSAPQDFMQEPAMDDRDSEKENMDVKHPLTKETQRKDNREVIQKMSNNSRQQQHVAKDSHVTTESHKQAPERLNTTRTLITRHMSQEDSGSEGLGMPKSVCTQTEEEMNPTSVSAVSDLQHAYTQTEGEEIEELTASPPLSPVPLPMEFADKMLFTGTFPIPADPARLAERIRRNRCQLSAAFDDTEYEPYGLPEVVMKGFADIPSGPSCPYIVRRGLLGTAAVPLPQKEQLQREETD